MNPQQNDLLARALEALESIKREEQSRSGHRVITLADVLQRYGGGTRTFTWSYVDGKRAISFEVNGEQRMSEVFEDALSQERSAFVELPIEYIHHDPLINPRPVNLNLHIYSPVALILPSGSGSSPCEGTTTVPSSFGLRMTVRGTSM